jgi:hypothetical protein
MRFCDEEDFGFGWHDDERMQRTSHALVADGGVWLIDPVEWSEAEDRARAAGEPRGVLQLLDRHERDCKEVAARLGVPHHVVPTEGVSGAPFDFLKVSENRLWREVALWWPGPRVLVCADALGTIPFFCAPGERAGVHPLLRLRPPRALRRVYPEHLLTGHGQGVHGDAAGALHEALRTSRRRLPAAIHGLIRSGR